MLLHVEVEQVGQSIEGGKNEDSRVSLSRKANGMPEDDSRARKERVVRSFAVEDYDERVCAIRIACRTGVFVSLLADDVSKNVTDDVDQIDRVRSGIGQA